MANGLKRNIKLTGIFASIALLMFNYQNCAPPSVGQGAITGEVRTADDWNQSKLLFVTSNQIFSNDDANLTLHGVCNRIGENGILSYSISESNSGLEVEAGEQNDFCEGGGFRLNVQNVASIDCDISYQVHVKSTLGYEDLMFISKSCNQ